MIIVHTISLVRFVFCLISKSNSEGMNKEKKLISEINSQMFILIDIHQSKNVVLGKTLSKKEVPYEFI